MVDILVFSNIKQVRRFVNRLPSKIAGISMKTLRRTIKKGEVMAKIDAPNQTGELKNLIVSSMVSKMKGKIISSVNNSYPYNLWVNQEPGFMTIDPRSRDNPTYYATNQPPFKYGQSGVKTKKGGSVSWTGKPGYFTKTFKKIEMTFAVELANNIGKELKRGG